MAWMKKLALAAALAALAGCALGPEPPRREAPPPASSPSPPSPPPEAPQSPYVSKPGVEALIDRSRILAQAGRPAEAAAQLDRALRMDPRDPFLLQERAERFLADGQWQQALNFAEKSFQRSVKAGVLCERNWQTIVAANQALGNDRAAREAARRREFC